MNMPGFTAENSNYKSNTYYGSVTGLTHLRQTEVVLVHPASGCCPPGKYCCGEVCCLNSQACLFGNCLPGGGGGGGSSGGCCPRGQTCCGSCESGTCDDVCIGPGQFCP